MNRPVYDRDVVVVPDRPRRRGRLLGAVVALLLLVVIVAVVLVLVIKGTSSNSAKKDVTVASCSAPGGGQPQATGTIRNHSSKTSIYVIRLKFTDAQGNTVSEGVTSVASVGAAENANWKLTGDRGVKGPVQCVVTGVSRTNLPGQ